MQDVVELVADRRNVVVVEIESEWIRHATKMNNSTQVVRLVRSMINIVMVMVDLRYWLFGIVDANLLQFDGTEIVVETTFEIALE